MQNDNNLFPLHNHILTHFWSQKFENCIQLDLTVLRYSLIHLWREGVAALLATVQKLLKLFVSLRETRFS